MKLEKNKQISFIILVTALFILSSMTQQVTAKKISPLQKAEIQQEYIHNKFRYILNGVKRYRIKEKITSTQDLIKLAHKYKREKKIRKQNFTLKAIAHKQIELLHIITELYYEQTMEIRHFFGQKEPKKILKNQKALKYFRLAQNEEQRGLTYKRIHHYKLAIHTFQLARSYYFYALNEAKIQIPDHFTLALNSLKSLPKFNQPPQIR